MILDRGEATYLRCLTPQSSADGKYQVSAVKPLEETAAMQPSVAERARSSYSPSPVSFAM